MKRNASLYNASDLIYLLLYILQLKGNLRVLKFKKIKHFEKYYLLGHMGKTRNTHSLSTYAYYKMILFYLNVSFLHQKDLLGFIFCCQTMHLFTFVIGLLYLVKTVGLNASARNFVFKHYLAIKNSRQLA